MIIYTYFCDLCNKTFEILCSLAEYRSVVNCKFCKKSRGVNRVYQQDNVYTGIKNYNTLGSIAEQNTKKYGKEKCQKMAESFKTKKKGPKKFKTMTEQDYLNKPSGSERLRKKGK